MRSPCPQIALTAVLSARKVRRREGGAPLHYVEGNDQLVDTQDHFTRTVEPLRQCARQNLRANGRTLLPCGRTLGRTPSTLSLDPGKPAIGFFSRAAILPEVAEHVREAREDMTNGRT